MPLTRVVYYSIVHPRLIEQIPETVNVIQRQAALRNRDHDVSGALVFADYFFAQALEGRRRAVSDLLGRLYRDDRHVSLQLVSAGPIRRRAFTGWHGVSVGAEATLRAITRRYCAGTAFTPSEMAPSALVAFLREVVAAVDAPPPIVEVEEIGWDDSFVPPAGDKTEPRTAGPYLPPDGALDPPIRS